jgi:DNA-binding LacI/PurR family transcriptional regulator
MGEIALNMLAKIISGEEVETQVLLPVELVVRDSCAPPLTA